MYCWCRNAICIKKGIINLNSESGMTIYDRGFSLNKLYSTGLIEGGRISDCIGVVVPCFNSVNTEYQPSVWIKDNQQKKMAHPSSRQPHWPLTIPFSLKQFYNCVLASFIHCGHHTTFMICVVMVLTWWLPSALAQNWAIPPDLGRLGAFIGREFTDSRPVCVVGR